ncbi:MAG: O-methyltransferase [Paenibacillaceae bacterium]|jgi:hypothetical protein|nr:O-methyltransferase [Paenibacillaceae bacterium]
MSLEQMSLIRQMDMVIRTLDEELRYLSSGTVFVQIRNDAVGKFGIKHDPIEMGANGLPHMEVFMTDSHIKAFRQLAVGCMEHKRNWTHGEIYFEFTMRKNVLSASVQFESNYNMANLLGKMFPPKP